MPAFLLLDKEMVHVEQMVRRLAGLDATDQLSRSTAVVNKAYWRRRVEEVADRSKGDLALVERAATLLRVVDKLPEP
ncbi:hypothetical protein AWB81_08497 [Caballeronia arationis]|uniref:hypothetical protein n=1 Tax=Caballeronia arationis TaxID=1777142 RepID=UPI00074CAF8B|nr:hypothetical protein [Caballeronia arationis]SAL08003.1 hypothetical protein AWB81_08497 [Caballeronia arationis]